MIGSGLLERYDRLNQWLDGLSRGQYALVMGSSSFITRTVVGYIYADRSLRRSALDGGASALGSAAVYYLLDPRRPEFPTLYRRVTEGHWRG